MPTMSASLEDPVVRSVVDEYRTAELATLGRSGAPIAWPATPMYRPDSGTFLFTTAIGFPQKAYNIRRDPRVALLFSDPTGSGLDGMPQVLVQGTATCTEHIVTSPQGHEGLEEWWLRLWGRQPNGESLGADPISRRLMAWYYQRLVLTVTPTRVHVRPPLPAGAPTVRSDGGRARRGSTSGEAAALLSGYDSAVLVARDAGGQPWLLRVRPELDAGTGVLAVDVPPGEPVEPGPARLLCHGHDAQLWNMTSGVVVGDLVRRDAGWGFVATRIVPGAATDPVRTVQTIRGCRRSAQQYLDRRHLTPPSVDWAAFGALKAEARRRAVAVRT
jgi:Pyridoxamine 5'-phosphate oxidase